MPRAAACMDTSHHQVVTRIADQHPQPQQLSGAGAALGAASAWLAPALGEGWGQAASCRVALFWEGIQRYALLVKAKEVPHLPASCQQQQGQQQQQLCVPYQVGPDGISA